MQCRICGDVDLLRSGPTGFRFGAPNEVFCLRCLSEHPELRTTSSSVPTSAELRSLRASP